LTAEEISAWFGLKRAWVFKSLNTLNRDADGGQITNGKWRSHKRLSLVLAR
jgi:hypothetical protein